MADTSPHAEAGLRQRHGDQPLPVSNGYPDIQSQVIADIEGRRELGIRRYGTALQPHNGRDMLRDAYEEAMDLTIYLKGCLVERDGGAVAERQPTPIAWLAYYADGSGVVAFASELAAYKHAISGAMSVVGVLDGEGISDAERRLRA